MNLPRLSPRSISTSARAQVAGQVVGLLEQGRLQGGDHPFRGGGGQRHGTSSGGTDRNHRHRNRPRPAEQARPREIRGPLAASGSPRVPGVRFTRGYPGTTPPGGVPGGRSRPLEPCQGLSQDSPGGAYSRKPRRRRARLAVKESDSIGLPVNDMSEPRRGWTDHQVEQVVGSLLRVGVLTAAAVTLLGAVLYLAQDGLTVPRYDKFRGEPPGLERVPGHHPRRRPLRGPPRHPVRHPAAHRDAGRARRADGLRLRLAARPAVRRGHGVRAGAARRRPDGVAFLSRRGGCVSAGYRALSRSRAALASTVSGGGGMAGGPLGEQLAGGRRAGQLDRRQDADAPQVRRRRRRRRDVGQDPFEPTPDLDRFGLPGGVAQASPQGRVAREQVSQPRGWRPSRLSNSVLSRSVSRRGRLRSGPRSGGRRLRRSSAASSSRPASSQTARYA